MPGTEHRDLQTGWTSSTSRFKLVPEIFPRNLHRTLKFAPYNIPFPTWFSAKTIYYEQAISVLCLYSDRVSYSVLGPLDEDREQAKLRFGAGSCLVRQLLQTYMNSLPRNWCRIQGSGCFYTRYSARVTILRASSHQPFSPLDFQRNGSPTQHIFYLHTRVRSTPGRLKC